MRKTLKERFEAKIFFGSPDGCWYWLGALGCRDKNRGKFNLNGENCIAARVGYELYVGPIGDNHVLHKCDNPMCVNPDHLFLGDNLQNMKDKVSKGRQPIMSGEFNPNHKLTREDVLYIRNSTKLLRELSLEFGMGTGQLSKVKRKILWKTIQ